jgi:hypothetical protein
MANNANLSIFGNLRGFHFISKMHEYGSPLLTKLP